MSRAHLLCVVRFLRMEKTKNCNVVRWRASPDLVAAATEQLIWATIFRRFRSYTTLENDKSAYSPPMIFHTIFINKIIPKKKHRMKNLLFEFSKEFSFAQPHWSNMYFEKMAYAICHSIIVSMIFLYYFIRWIENHMKIEFQIKIFMFVRPLTMWTVFFGRFWPSPPFLDKFTKFPTPNLSLLAPPRWNVWTKYGKYTPLVLCIFSNCLL